VRTIVGLVFLLALSMQAVAQTPGKISGTVRDAQTGEPLIGANILLVGTSQGASAQLDGTYFILNVTPGQYDLQASFLGYRRVTVRGIIVNGGRTTTADFALSSEAIEQQEVIVQAVRPDVEREKTSTSAIIRFDEVQGIAGMRDVDDVIGLAADVTDGHFRGGRTNEEYYTLQGLGIINPLDASAAFRPIMSAVEEVEVVTSGFGAQYGNAQSGVVNITMKEGRRDRWRTRVEGRFRAPGRKYFGPSLYDQQAQPYLQKLADTDFWLYGDTTTGGRPPVFTFFNSQDFGGDTAIMVQAARLMWETASKYDLNSNYWTTIDYSVEGSTGGPIDEGVTMFLALRSEVDHPIVPTEQPNQELQVMGNVVFELWSGATLRMSGGSQYEFDNVLAGGTGFYNWVWDRILGISQRERRNRQIGLRFTETVSDATFYEVKLNTLATSNRVGASPWGDTVTDVVRRMESGNAIITREMSFLDFQLFNGKTFTYLANTRSTYTNERTFTGSLDASFTSQVTSSHLINAGVQANLYRINVDDVDNLRSGSGSTSRRYTANPYEIGLFVQDKMEFEGMIANVGLRWDLWSSNYEAFVDQFNPFVILDASGNPTNFRNADSAARTDVAPVGRIQPRLGVSFPVSPTTVFHLNYGTFMQRPSFQYVLGDGRTNSSPPSAPSVSTLGNPRLLPEVTNSYDVGVMQGLGEGFTIDVSGFYKDIKNQVEQALYTDLMSGTSYASYFNRDYADVRGFRVSLAKRRGDLNALVNYQFSVATGKSSSPTNAPVVIKRNRDGSISTDAVTQVPIRDVLLNFDRTHNLIVNLGYRSPRETDLRVFGVDPLADISIAATYTIRSGRPYTSSLDNLDINGRRTPPEENTNLRLSKELRDLFGVKAVVYFEVFNLFNSKTFNYNYLFATANKIDGNTQLNYYELHPFDDPYYGVRWYDGETGPMSAYPVDHSFVLYQNAPRSYTFGLSLEF
jgi:outer membrane receptor protein involved in Fe transport